MFATKTAYFISQLKTFLLQTSCSNWLIILHVTLNMVDPEPPSVDFWTKTREFIVFRKGKRQTNPLADNSWATRVDTIRVLGVTLSSNLQMDIHVDTALATCASSMYALRVLRSHGLPQQSLHEVAKMTTVSSLMYASPVWWGFTSAGDRKRIGAFLARIKRRAFLPPQSPDADQMADVSFGRPCRRTIVFGCSVE